MRKTLTAITIFFILTIILLSALAYSLLTDISYKEGFKLKEKTIMQNRRTIKIGVVSRYSPSLILDGYQPVIDYLSENTPYEFSLVLSKDYNDTVKQLKEGKITFAFLGDMVFVKNMEKERLIPVVCPVNKDGKPFLKAVAIVRENATIKNFCQLKDKTIALPSPSSFSYRWGILKAKECGISVSVKQFSFHHTVVLQVLNGVCDGGVVREYVAKEFEKKGIKIIDYSPSIPSPPLVALSSIDKNLLQTVRNTLLKFKPEKSESSIDREFYYGFTVPSPKIYINFQKYLKEKGIYL